MRKTIRMILIVGLVILLLLQFYRPARNNFGGQELNDISKVYGVPQDVNTILKTSCYDCHSNNTEYPWYANLQPIRSFLDSHIAEGKAELNFSEFASYSKRKQEAKFNSIVSQIKSGEMPLKSYSILHSDATLSPERRKLVISWIESVQDSLNSDY